MPTSTEYSRLHKLGMNSSDLLDKQTAAAFELTFADPTERFKLFQQLIELRMLLTESGIHSKEDLRVLLGQRGL